MEPETLSSFDSHKETLRIHARQTRLQILLPILLICLMMVGVIVLTIILSIRPGGAAVHMLWADISLIWLLMPTIFLFIIPAALIIALIFGMSKLINGLPRYGALAQFYAQRVADEVRKVADKAASPAVKVGGWSAGWRALRDLLRVRKPPA